MPPKSRGTGPTSVVRQDKLFDVLKQEQDDMMQLLNGLGSGISSDILILIEEQLQEVRKAAKIWIKLYHSLVLLNAVMDPPSLNGLNWYKEGDLVSHTGCPTGYHCCLEDSHGVPAWAPGFEEGWLGYSHSDQLSCDPDWPPPSNNATSQSLIEIFETNFALNILETSAQNLTDDTITDALAQSTGIGSDNVLGRPLMLSFLAKFNSLFPGSIEFDPKVCLETCLRSVSQIRPGENNENKEIYAEKALYLLAELWGEDLRLDLPAAFWDKDFEPDLIRDLLGEDVETNFESWTEQVKSRLAEMNSWSEASGIETENFKIWLRNKHRVSSPQSPQSRDLLSEAITTNNASAKLVIRGMKAMLLVNLKALEFIYQRCFEGSASAPYSDLNETTTKLTVGQTHEMSEDEKKQWSNLRFATYGAIVWHIFHQATPAIKRIFDII